MTFKCAPPPVCSQRSKIVIELISTRPRTRVWNSVYVFALLPPGCICLLRVPRKCRKALEASSWYDMITTESVLYVKPCAVATTLRLLQTWLYDKRETPARYHELFDSLKVLKYQTNRKWLAESAGLPIQLRLWTRMWLLVVKDNQRG